MRREPRAPKRKCIAHKSDGKPCANWAVQGATVCTAHGGAAPQVAARAAVRAEVMRWGLGDANVDPGQVMLRLVSQSAARAEHYSRLLEQAYDAAERLRGAHEAGELLVSEGHRLDGVDEDDEEPAAIQRAREDLDRVFISGGVAALVGNVYSSTNSGSVFATGEAIRGLAKLEADERDRCAGFAAKAIAAGLNERLVRVAEREASIAERALMAALDDIGLTADQQREASARLVHHLRLVG